MYEITNIQIKKKEQQTLQNFFIDIKFLNIIADFKQITFEYKSIQILTLSKSIYLGNL